ncbi:MAG: hypothetical protein PVF89_08770 [Lysobacterales bacterium]|jgi:hypothetical protein
MQRKRQHRQTSDDPLGLRELQPLEPAYDGWEEVAEALQRRRQAHRRWRTASGALAVAASLALVLTIVLRDGPDSNPVATAPDRVATNRGGQASLPVKDKAAAKDLDALIALSQSLEAQVKTLRHGSGPIPAESAVYTAELEDLVAQVDNELSLTPDSVDLWGQRVNLLLDLTRIYQQQWQIDYDRLASL